MQRPFSYQKTQRLDYSGGFSRVFEDQMEGKIAHPSTGPLLTLIWKPERRLSYWIRPPFQRAAALSHVCPRSVGSLWRTGCRRGVGVCFEAGRGSLQTEYVSPSSSPHPTHLGFAVTHGFAPVPSSPSHCLARHPALSSLGSPADCLFRNSLSIFGSPLSAPDSCKLNTKR